MSHPLGLEPTLPIVQLGDPVLRLSAQEWTGQPQGQELDQLISLMRSTMLHAPGVGLAAPQIGLSLRLAVLQDLWPISEEVAQARERSPLEFMVVLNPRYEAIGERTATHYEGCLSMEGYTAAVTRPSHIAATWLDADGEERRTELHGWQARIFQHETDHLDGTLYIDKAHTRSLATSQNYARLWSAPGPELAREALGF